MSIHRAIGPVLLYLVASSVLTSLSAVAAAPAQSLVSSGTIQGVVTDPTGAVVPNATVALSNPVTGFSSSATTDANGRYLIRQVPFNHYHVSVTAPGFASVSKDLDVRSAVPISLPITMEVGTAKTAITVEGGSEDLIESTPVAHTDVSHELISKLPVQHSGSPLSSIVALATPGVVADSNGMFHPLGEHADTTFTLDNQSISDQQSRVFSNQLSPDAIASMEVISGVAPAEFGDKASLIVRTSTKSGVGLTRPTGSLTTGYSSFGTSNVDLNFGMGGTNFGNFLSVSGANSDRFLDTPEFRPLHAKGNSQSILDHIDYQLGDTDMLHLNLSVARSWFQVPNTYDQQAAGQDQRQQLKSFNIAPSWTHQFNPNTLLITGAYVRQDRVSYYPSADVFSDQPVTLSQGRRLTNAGFKADLSYVKGIHNAKIGGQFSHTFLSERFGIGITDPTFNSPCADAAGVPVAPPGVADTARCVTAGLVPNEAFEPGLLPIDLTRGGSTFRFRGRTDIKQVAFYAQDTLRLGPWDVMLGLRGDNYNGLTQASGVQPRIGLAYTIARTGTVLRAAYGRVFLTPYNENLIVSSSTGLGGLASGAFGENPITPARRNHFNVGFQQAFGSRLVVTGDYFWKFTTGDYDFDTILNTPLAFPIQWRKSKIDGVSMRVNFPSYRGLTAYSVLGHTRSRFFGPEIGGILFNSPVDATVFRIDHDQAFQQTTHLQYQFSRKAPWIGFTWRYESGLVAGEVPDLETALTFTGNQQAQIGLDLGNTFATPTSPIRSCSSPDFGATRVRIPAPGTADDDKNPPRIAPRHLFDLAMGMDNLFRGDRYTWDLQLSALNLTNKVALYNFLSTFSGTHFVAPRTLQAQLTFRF